MENNMKFYLDEILDDSNENNNNNTMKTDLARTIDLLNEMRISFEHQMEAVLKPVYKTEHDPIDVLILPGDLKLIDKLILVILRNRDNATLAQLMQLTGAVKQTCNNSLNILRNEGYVIKLKVSTYALNQTKIY